MSAFVDCEYCKQSLMRYELDHRIRCWSMYREGLVYLFYIPITSDLIPQLHNINRSFKSGQWKYFYGLPWEEDLARLTTGAPWFYGSASYLAFRDYRNEIRKEMSNGNLTVAALASGLRLGGIQYLEALFPGIAKRIY